MGTRVSHFSTFFKNWYATNWSPWWDTSIASSKNFGQFRHHLELAPEQIILQGVLIQYTKEILVYQFFWIYFIICSCEKIFKSLDQFRYGSFDTHIDIFLDISWYVINLKCHKMSFMAFYGILQFSYNVINISIWATKICHNQETWIMISKIIWRITNCSEESKIPKSSKFPL